MFWTFIAALMVGPLVAVSSAGTLDKIHLQYLRKNSTPTPAMIERLSVDSLWQVVKSGTDDPVLQGQAVRVLFQKDTSSVESYCQKSLLQQNFFIRLNCLWGLASVGRVKHLSMFRQHALQDPALIVRDFSYEVLTYLGLDTCVASQVVKDPRNIYRGQPTELHQKAQKKTREKASRRRPSECRHLDA